jgi:hypothetical protein
MKVLLKTNLPDTVETRIGLIKIISHALIEHDIALEIEEYADLPQVSIAAMNNVILQEVIKEQEKSQN